MKGTVKWFNDGKRFGFVTSDEGEDAFVDFSYIQNRASQTLVLGETVEFDRVEGPKGPQAHNVRVVDPADVQEPLPMENDFDHLAVLLVDTRLRLVGVSRDGQCRYVDPVLQHHGILYVAGAETLAFASAVDEFEHLINTANVTEHDFQGFFVRNPDFILSDDYRAARSQVVLEQSDSGGPLIPDFFLEPVEQGGLCDLLEIKRPRTKLFAIKKNRLRYSSAVFEACAQLRTYAEFFDNPLNRERVRQRYRLDAFRPRLFLLLGRRGTATALDRRRVDSDLPPRLTLTTYDDILDRVKNRLSRMRTGRSFWPDAG